MISTGFCFCGLTWYMLERNSSAAKKLRRRAIAPVSQTSAGVHKAREGAETKRRHRRPTPGTKKHQTSGKTAELPSPLRTFEERTVPPSNVSTHQQGPKLPSLSKTWANTYKLGGRCQSCLALSSFSFAPSLLEAGLAFDLRDFCYCRGCRLYNMSL